MTEEKHVNKMCTTKVSKTFWSRLSQIVALGIGALTQFKRSMDASSGTHSLLVPTCWTKSYKKSEVDTSDMKDAWTIQVYKSI